MATIIAGIILLIFPFLPKYRLRRLSKIGERCEGSIIHLDLKNPDDTESIDKITVRFRTKKNELITGDLMIYFIFSASLFEVGDKIPVIYDPAKPSDFTMEKLPSDIVIKAFCLGVGTLCLVFGISDIMG